MGLLKVFSIDVYALLDPGATLSFVTPLVDKKFDIFSISSMNLLLCLPWWMSRLFLREYLEIVL